MDPDKIHEELQGIGKEGDEEVSPDSNNLTGLPVGVSKSIAQGILELGLTSTKPDSNCPPRKLTSTRGKGDEEEGRSQKEGG